MLLRPYQTRLVARAKAALERHGDTLAVAATGAGKTIMLAQLAREIGGKRLVLQHRQELVRQNMAKFRQVDGTARCGLWTADSKSFRGDVTFAMVQSLTRHTARMPRLDLIIADEAHHCAAPSWRAIIEAAREKNPDVLLAGFTATPSRSDRRSLRRTFSNVCDQITIRELVSLGFLVPPRAFVINVGETQSTLARLGVVSDFGEQDAVADILNTVAVNAEIIRHWRERAADRPTVIFAATVAHAQDVAAAFSAAGIPAACVHGGLGDMERKRILGDMTTGKIRVVVNVMVLTEGWDYPPVSCVILLRKCSEKGPLIQMAGRGLRTVNQQDYPGVRKTDCLILDFGTSLLTHGDLSADVALGNDEDYVPGEGENALKTCPRNAKESGEYRFPDRDGNTGCGAELPAQTRVCPFCGFRFEKTEGDDAVTRVELTEMDILNASPFRYVDLFGTDRILMASGFEAWAGVFSPDGDAWTALGKTHGGAVQTIHMGDRLQAMAAADDFLRCHETDSAARKTKRWLDDPASDKQIALLNDSFGYGLQRDLLGRSALTKYAACCHTNFQFARKQIEAQLGV